jgi:hypothetical protein
MAQQQRIPEEAAQATFVIEIALSFGRFPHLS